MATTRMTTRIREALLGKLLSRAFQERGDAHVREVADFARRVHAEAFRDDLARMYRLPDGWLPTSTSMRAVLAGDVRSVGFNGALDGYSLPHNFRLAGVKLLTEDIHLRFTATRNGSVLSVFDPEHPLSVEFEHLRRAQQDLDAEVGKARRTTEATLGSVSSVEKLITVWPEVEAFAKEFIGNGEQKAILPAIPRAELNAALGLPPQ